MWNEEKAGVTQFPHRWIFPRALLSATLLCTLLCRAQEGNGFPEFQVSPRDEKSNTVPRPQTLPIDLPTVLRLAGTDALEVKLAGERTAEASARRLGADMQFLPVVQLGYNNVWQQGETQNTNGTFLNVDKQSSQLGGGAALNLQIGEDIYRSLAARKRVLGAVSDVRVSAEQTQLGAVNAYFDLVLARAQQAIYEESLKQADETVRLAQQKLDAGAGLLSEVKRAEAARAAVKQLLAGALEKVRVGSLNLTVILHIDPLVTLVPAQQPQDLLVLVSPERDITDLAIDAVWYRPEFKSSRAYWAALDDERRAAIFAPLIPTITASAFAGGFGQYPGRLRHTADFAAGLGWKVGAGGIGDVSRIRLTESQQKQASIRFMELSDQIVGEVVQNLAHVVATHEQVEMAKEEVAAAAETLRLSRERFVNGAAITLEVITADQALFAARSHMAEGISEYNKGEYGLLRSIGGFRNTDALMGDKKTTP